MIGTNAQEITVFLEHMQGQREVYEELEVASAAMGEVELAAAFEVVYKALDVVIALCKHDLQKATTN